MFGSFGILGIVIWALAQSLTGVTACDVYKYVPKLKRTTSNKLVMAALPVAAVAAKKQVQQKHWCVTVNDAKPLLHYSGTSDEDFEINLVGPEAAVCKHQVAWWVGQLEKAPTTGNLHLQMHVCFKAKVGFSGAKHFFDQSNMAGAHLEPCADLTAHLAYVVKADTRHMGPYRSPGAPADGGPVQGKRSDLSAVVEAAQSGAGLPQLWKEFPLVMVRAYKGVEKLVSTLCPAPVRPNMVTVVFYGVPGTGKSTLAAKLTEELFPDERPFYKPIGKWFCAYLGQKAVVMDDFDGKGQACREIKNIFDKTPCIVEIKGGHVNLASELIVVTSNTDPRNWFPGEDPVHTLAVLRRCLCFRVEESLVLNAGKRVGFGLNGAGQTLLDTVKRAMLTEVEEGEGSSGFRGSAAIARQETHYMPYGNQIMPVPPARVEVIAEPMIVVDSDDEVVIELDEESVPKKRKLD